MNKALDRKERERELGQSMVEFVLASLVLALTLAGILDLGRAYFAKIAITDAAGEGALYAAYSPNCLYAGTTTCLDPNNVTYRVRHASESKLVDWEKVKVGTIVDQKGLVAGNIITVTVDYSFSLITPFISGLVGDDILHIRAEAAQPIQ